MPRRKQAKLPMPDKLSDEHRAWIKAWLQKSGRGHLLRGLGAEWIRCRNYYWERERNLSRPELAFQNWLINKTEWAQDEQPQMTGPRGGKMEPLSKEI